MHIDRLLYIYIYIYYLLVLLLLGYEFAQALEGLRDDLGRRVVLNGVLAQELETQLVLSHVKEDMFHTQRGAADLKIRGGG